MENSDYPGTIHFNDTYMNFIFDYNQFPTYLAVIPWFYMLPSFFVILKIFNVYLTTNWQRLEPGKNQHVFLIISLSQFTCFALFILDYFNFRLPATGIVTAKCARTIPNQWIKMIFFSTTYVNYAAMIFPCLMPVIRLVIISFPKEYNKINKLLVRIGIPAIIIYPIFFTFFLIPAVGVCKQLGHPYPFGSVLIYYAQTIWGLRNSYFYLCNIIFWLFCSVLANLILFLKVSKARSKLVGTQRSGVSYKAETSITITTLSMIAFYLTNGMFVLVYILLYGTSKYMSYSTLMRPFGNDMQTCIVSWVFYLTHPVFKTRVVPPPRVGHTSFFRRMVVSTG